MNISLTENEERALSEILWSISACSSGCCYEEMENPRKIVMNVCLQKPFGI